MSSKFPVPVATAGKGVSIFLLGPIYIFYTYPLGTISPQSLKTHPLTLQLAHDPFKKMFPTHFASGLSIA